MNPYQPSESQASPTAPGFSRNLQSCPDCEGPVSKFQLCFGRDKTCANCDTPLVFALPRSVRPVWFSLIGLLIGSHFPAIVLYWLMPKSTALIEGLQTIVNFSFCISLFWLLIWRGRVAPKELTERGFIVADMEAQLSLLRQKLESE